MSPLSSPPPSLSDRLRRGDAAALLELAHATHGRALAVVRTAGWGEDPEALLLDAYVALYFRRADAPDSGAESWALAEVLAYCERRGSGRGGAGRGECRRRAVRRGGTGTSLGARVGRAVRAVVESVAHTMGREIARPPAIGGSAS